MELASGLVFGRASNAEIAEPSTVPLDPIVALEAALLPSLQRGPCVVSFSGGRDSSAVLAVATAVARREGLPLPVPATNVFPGAQLAQESEWQERVIAHLGLEDWVRIELTDELDCAGPIARSIIERHGLLWPFNVHFHWPLLEAARGGALLTGIGGDELLGTSQWARAASVLSGSTHPTPRDVLRIGLALSPIPVRRSVLRRRQVSRFSWLTRAANDQVVAAWSGDLAREPLRRARRWNWWRSLRQVDVGFRSLDLIAGDHDVHVRHPLTDTGFAISVGAWASARGIQERTALMRTLFAHVLPRDVQERSTKASFDEVFWGPDSRQLARDSFAGFADLDVVDAAGLQKEWGMDVPDAHSFLLLQSILARGTESTELAVGSVAGGATNA